MPATMQTYEQRLDADLDLALAEGSMHFDEKSAVHDSLRRIIARLDALGVAYAVVGGMALFIHGFRRFTDDVDLLVTPASLEIIHRELEGLGYLRPHAGSKNLRDTQSGVRIEFLVSGGYPGDGKPKPVIFPDPAEVAVEIGGIRLLGLPTLIELKLASGMSAAHRLKDLADVQELVRVLDLPHDFAEGLNPFVREKFAELWTAVRNAPPE